MGDVDVESLLDRAVEEEKKQENGAPPADGAQENGERERDRDRRRDSGDRDRDRRRDRGDRDRDRDRDRRDRDRDRRHREIRRSRSRSPPRRRKPRTPSPSPDARTAVEREQEEALRDDLTVLVQRIHPRADDFEIFEFFSQAGAVKDIRLIRDQRSGKSKGVGYVEYKDVESVMKALALNGIAFRGQPLLVQASMAEKNRLAQAAKNVAAAAELMGGAAAEPTKLMVTELHPHISANDLREVFSPFGELSEVKMVADATSGSSFGVANVTFVNPSEAKDAQAAINGLELAGRSIAVQFVQEIPQALSTVTPGLFSSGLLSGLAAGMPSMPNMPNMPNAAMPAGGAALEDNLGAERAALLGRLQGAAPANPPSTCVLLKNMFDPNGQDEQNDKDFFDDLRDDVQEECGKHGGVLGAKIDRASAGHVYIRFADAEAAGRALGALNNRWFAGKQISGDYLTEAEFDGLSF